MTENMHPSRGFDLIVANRKENIMTLECDLITRLAGAGAVLLRGFSVSLESFSAFVLRVSKRTTIDPARAFFAPEVQLVDSGNSAVGLHCENGTTPNIPEVVWFFSARAARSGSQTTLCDGYLVWDLLAGPVRELFQNQDVVYSRNLPESLWTRYLRHGFPSLAQAPTLDQAVLDQAFDDPARSRMTINPDRSLTMVVKIPMVHATRFGSRLAWANSLLGPSYNYQPPTITLEDGSEIPPWVLGEIRQVTNACSVEIPWEDGDVLAVGNTRVMHGRRAILDPNRKLYTALSFV